VSHSSAGTTASKKHSGSGQKQARDSHVQLPMQHTKAS